MIGQWFKNMVMIMLSGLLLIDIIGGYALAQGEATSLMIIYKGLLAASISFYLARLKSFWYFMVPTVLFVILFVFASFQSGSIGNLGEKLALFFRFIFNSVIFIFLVSELKANRQFGRKVLLFIYFSFAILAGSILLGAFGFGNSTYSDAEVGSKGYFEGGNDIGVAYLVLSSFLLYGLYLQNRSLIIRLCFILLQLTIALLASTKLVILGSLINVLYVLWSFVRINIWIKYLYLSLVVAILLSGLYWGIQSSGLLDRLLTNFDKGDILFVLLSGRDNTVLEGFDRFFKSDFLTKFFGFPIIQNSEMDGFDVLFNFGYIGVFYFMVLAILLFIRLNKLVSVGYSNAKFGRFIFIFCSTLGLIAGHTLFSTQGGLFLFVIIAMSYYQPFFNVQK
jgi:hypothetical protein